VLKTADAALNAADAPAPETALKTADAPAPATAFTPAGGAATRGMAATLTMGLAWAVLILFCDVL
jgi:hypothetical protein